MIVYFSIVLMTAQDCLSFYDIAEREREKGIAHDELSQNALRINCFVQLCCLSQLFNSRLQKFKFKHHPTSSWRAFLGDGVPWPWGAACCAHPPAPTFYGCTFAPDTFRKVISSVWLFPWCVSSQISEIWDWGPDFLSVPMGPRLSPASALSTLQWKVKVKLLVTQSCPTLCDPMNCSPPGSSVHRFPRREYWSG